MAENPTPKGYTFDTRTGLDCQVCDLKKDGKPIAQVYGENSTDARERAEQFVHADKAKATIDALRERIAELERENTQLKAHGMVETTPTPEAPEAPEAPETTEDPQATADQDERENTPSGNGGKSNKSKK